MNKLKLLCFFLTVLFGVFLIVFGEQDDSPGAQFLGLVLFIIGVVGGIKTVRNRKKI